MDIIYYRRAHPSSYKYYAFKVYYTLFKAFKFTESISIIDTDLSDIKIHYPYITNRNLENSYYHIDTKDENTYYIDIAQIQKISGKSRENVKTCIVWAILNCYMYKYCNKALKNINDLHENKINDLRLLNLPENGVEYVMDVDNLRFLTNVNSYFCLMYNFAFIRKHLKCKINMSYISKFDYISPIYLVEPFKSREEKKFGSETYFYNGGI